MNLKSLSVALILVSLVSARAADDSAIVDGPKHGFTISAPKGWKLTYDQQFQAAFYPADSTFEKSPVIMYVRSANKSELHVSNIAELNHLDLKGIQEREPAAKSEKIGALKIGSGAEIPFYSFSGGGYCELVAYAEQAKTITVLVVSAETPEQMKAARAAFEELVGSYGFISDGPQTPKQLRKPKETELKPTRQDGLSIHMLPDRVAKIGGGHGGFTVTDPETKQRGATYAEPKELLAYFQHLPMSVQLNGIWIVTTDPSSYSEGEKTKLKALAATCGEKKIPVYVCRASELPEGWKRLE